MEVLDTPPRLYLDTVEGTYIQRSSLRTFGPSPFLSILLDPKRHSYIVPKPKNPELKADTETQTSTPDQILNHSRSKHPQA